MRAIGNESEAYLDVCGARIVYCDLFSLNLDQASLAIRASSCLDLQSDHHHSVASKNGSPKMIVNLKHSQHVTACFVDSNSPAAGSCDLAGRC